MEKRLTEKAKEALEIAKTYAKSWQHSYVGTEHVLLGLLMIKDSAAAMIFR
jgi:ATP-dependent Clp protease ATP-binding subunit ClpC